MKKIFAAASVILFIGCLKAQTVKDFAGFRDNFVTGYKALNIPDLELSYAENLQHIQPVYNIQKQTEFFNDASKKLETFNRRYRFVKIKKRLSQNETTSFNEIVG